MGWPVPSGTSIAAVPRLGSKGALLDITGSINGSIVFAGKNVKSTASGSMFVGQLTEAGVQEWGRAVRNPNGVVTSGAGIAVDPTTREIFAVGTAKRNANSTLLVAEYSSKGRLGQAATQ